MHSYVEVNTSLCARPGRLRATQEGVLVCDTGLASDFDWPDSVRSGDWFQSCSPLKMNGDRLRAYCANFDLIFPRVMLASIDTSDCQKPIVNWFGSLKCGSPLG